MAVRRPVVGITADLNEAMTPARCVVAQAYATAVALAGGVPVILAPIAEMADAYAEVCHAFVLTGGDDPRMEAFGEATHPKATPVAAERQRFETALLGVLEGRPGTPVLGVCLGMQMMSLTSGGRMNQHMPETLATAAEHWERHHAVAPVVEGVFASGGMVQSKHRQCITDAGRLTVAAVAEDGVIEAVVDPGRRFYVGVQWHPERTEERALGLGLFARLVEAARG